MRKIANTFLELLNSKLVNWDTIYNYLIELHGEDNPENFTKLKDAYSVVIEELKQKPRPDSFCDLFLSTKRFYGTQEDYISVLSINGEFKEGYEDTEGVGGRDQFFATDFTPWDEIAWAAVYLQDNLILEPEGFLENSFGILSCEKIIAEVLYDLTFYSFSEKHMFSKSKELKILVDE